MYSTVCIHSTSFPRCFPLIIQRLFLDQFCCNFRSKTHIAMTFFVIILLYFLFIVFTHVDSFSGLPLQYSLTFISKHSLEFFNVMIVCHVKIMILSLNHELTKKYLKSQNYMKIMKKNLKIIYVCEQ